jgi:hypothetical protein
MSRRARHRRRLAPAPRSGDRRARVSGPSEGRVPDREVHGCPSMGACAFYAHADGVPLLGAQRTPAVAGATEQKGRRPLSTNRTGLGLSSNVTPRRVAPSRRPRCLRPSRRKDAEGLLLRTLLRPPAHAAHTLPTAVGSCFRGALQALDAEGTPPEHSRERAPFEPAGQPVPGTDDPSTPAWLGRRGR